MREREIFIEALERSNLSERAALLDEACKTDTDLRSRVERLLAAHERHESFILDSPPVPLQATIDHPISERPGTVIGPFKLLQQIGEGGMGIVFMAEQSEPIQRAVALKIIKPGMDTRQVIARFEAERQALAMMDHPNIARVLDAGATDSGRPYFVMELVKGVPITKYCDENHLPLRSRLELFVQVCQAVQHAHQKGIIHRDIKPTNVLVAEYDNRAVPKVIDFGVAKATTHKLTERTMFTEFGQVLGTMEYMSPEQAKFNQLDIDTRSDVYSLGVLLYELLAGSTPFGGTRLKEAAFEEMLRIIREEEPQKPSTRLCASDTLATIAANRHIEPTRLRKEIRGELDWIVMKALEKDRNRRYETATGLATDLQSHLNDETVLACPPSVMYRFGKFARRNKVALSIASATIATLLSVVAGLLISNRMIAAERDEKVQALAEKELALALAEAQAQMTYYKDALQYRHVQIGPQETEKMYRSVTRLLDRAANLPLVPLAPGEVVVRERIGHRQRDLAFMVRLAGRLDLSKDAFERSILTFEKLKEQVPDRVDYWHFAAESHRELGRIAMDRKRPVDAEREFRQAIELHEQRAKRLAGKQTFLTEEAAAYYDLARLLIKTGRRDEAVPLVTRGAGVEHLNDGQPSNLWARIQLADLLREAGEVDQELALYSDVVELAIAATPELRLRLAEGCSRMARLLRDKGRLEQAERTYRQAISLRGPLGPTAPPNVRLAQSFDYNDLAFVMPPAKRTDESVQAVRAGLELKQALVNQFPDNRDYQIHVAHSYFGLGQIAVDSGRTSDAAQAYGEAASILNNLVAEPPGTQQFERFLRDTLSRLGNAWERMGRPDDAKQVHQRALGRMSRLAVEFPDNADYQLELARSLRDAGDLDAAIAQCAKIIAKNSSVQETWNIRGDCNIRRGDFATAVEDFSTSLKLEPNRSEAWTGRAFARFRLRQWDSAVADYSAAIELAPQIHTNWHHRGLAYFELTHWNKAAADFTKIVDGWPDEAGGWYLRCAAYAQSNQHDKALADLRQAIARGYKDVEQLKNDPKLAPLRANDEFKKLLAELERKDK